MNHSNTQIEPRAVMEQIENTDFPSVFSKFPWIDCVFLVGSYASKEADNLSDVDFLVISNQKEQENVSKLTQAIASALNIPMDVIGIRVEKKLEPNFVPALVSSVTLFDHIDAAKKRDEILKQAGNPSLLEAKIMSIHMRAERIVGRNRHNLPFLVVASYGLGREVLRLLGYKALKSKFEIPLYASESIVSKRTASIIFRAGVLYYSAQWFSHKHAREVQDIENNVQWFFDWAWNMRKKAIEYVITSFGNRVRLKMIGT